MVSKARLDLPEPERPVTTISLSRGISTEMFLRLWTRAPCTAMVVLAAPRTGLAIGLELIRNLSEVNKCQLFDHNVAGLGEADGRRRLADESAIGKVLAGCRHTFDIEIPLEVGFELGRGPGFAGFAQVVEHEGEERAGARGEIVVDGVERGLDVLPGLLGVEHVRVDELKEIGVELHRLRKHFAAGELAGVDDFDAGEGGGGE